MNNPLPPMNWRRYWASYIGHGIQGTLAGALMIPWPLIGLALLVLYASYQGLEFARRGDTPGRDMLHFAIGFYIGLVMVLGAYYAPV